MRAGRRAKEVMGGLKASRPVAQCFINSVLETGAAVRHGHHGRAHQLHSENVQLLPLDVPRTHVDDRLEPHQRADHRGRHAMLPGARLGNQPGLAHTLGEQTLGEHLVRLVCAAVEQVFALQIDVAWQVAAARERRWAAGIVAKQAAQFRREAAVIGRIQERGFELLQGGNQNLRRVAPSEPSKAAA